MRVHAYRGGSNFPEQITPFHLAFVYLKKSIKL